MKEIIGRKMGMTQVYTEDGTMYAVTVIEVLPNVVTQKKTKDHDGYDAIHKRKQKIMTDMMQFKSVMKIKKKNP